MIWYGQVEMMDEERIPKQILKWISEKRRKRARPKSTWIGGIQRAMSEWNLALGYWKKLRIGRRMMLLIIGVNLAVVNNVRKIKIAYLL